MHERGWINNRILANQFNSIPPEIEQEQGLEVHTKKPVTEINWNKP